MTVSRRSLLLLAALVPAAAAARNLGGRFDDSPSREWFEGLLTPGGVSCCGLGDAHLTDDYEIVAGSARVRAVLPDGSTREYVVPPERVLTGKAGSNPAGHGVIFLSPNFEAAFCFVPTAQS